MLCLLSWVDEERVSRGRSAVEAPRRAGLVRVGAGARSRHPVERASYESEPGRGRGAPSSGLSFLLVSVFVSVLAIAVVPRTVGTDTM
jgi:hypothetical protein